ncbi:MAG: type II toxin-antitoxin system HicB family antitoxin [Methanothrix sp.]
MRLAATLSIERASYPVINKTSTNYHPLKYTVILEPQEEGGYTVRCLELPGAISQGETKEETLENIKEAIGLVLEVLSQELATSNAQVLEIDL